MILVLILIGVALAIIDRFTGRHLARMGTLRLTCLVALVITACVMLSK